MFVYKRFQNNNYDELVVYKSGGISQQTFACNTFSHFRNTVNISFKGTVIGRGILLKEEDGELSLNYFESGKKRHLEEKCRKK